jgi:hypothetical protein
MYNMKTYMENILRLSRSITFKFSYIGKHINREYNKVGIRISDDKYTWKYYQHMAGIPYDDDEDIYIYVPDIDEKKVLSKELLAKYPKLHQDLLEYGTSYNTLILEYSKQETLIKGILAPVDIETAIKAPEGAILSYSKALIGDNELSLILSLETYIKGMLSRWFIMDYAVIDDYYIPSILGLVYSKIPLEIMNIRLSKINTAEVHDYHLYEFFKSNKYLSNEVDVLTPESRMWLYKNIKYLNTNIGKSSTTESLIQDIFATNNLGIGELMLESSIPDVTNDYISTKKFKALKRNENYTLNNGKTYTLEEVATREGDLSSVEILKSAKYGNKIPTKLFELDNIVLFDNDPISVFEIIISNWAFLTKNGSYNVSLEFKDPNTRDIYLLNNRQALLLLLKLMLLSNGYEDTSNISITHMNIITIEDDMDLLMKDLLKSSISKPILEMLLNLRPIYSPRYGTVDAFNIYVQEVITYYRRVWLFLSNSNDALLATEVKHLLNRMTHRDTIVITTPEETIDELLIADKIDFVMNDGYVIEDTISKLFMTFTNCYFKESEKLNIVLSKFISIFNKLTSYTTKLLDTNNITVLDGVHFNNITTINGHNNGLVSVTDATFELYSRNLTALKGAILIGVENPEVDVVNTSPNLEYNKRFSSKSHLVMLNNEKLTSDILLTAHILHTYDTYPIRSIDGVGALEGDVKSISNSTPVNENKSTMVVANIDIDDNSTAHDVRLVDYKITSVTSTSILNDRIEKTIQTETSTIFNNSKIMEYVFDNPYVSKVESPIYKRSSLRSDLVLMGDDVVLGTEGYANSVVSYDLTLGTGMSGVVISPIKGTIPLIPSQTSQAISNDEVIIASINPRREFTFSYNSMANAYDGSIIVKDNGFDIFKTTSTRNDAILLDKTIPDHVISNVSITNSSNVTMNILDDIAASKFVNELFTNNSIDFFSFTNDSVESVNGYNVLSNNTLNIEEIIVGDSGIINSITNELFTLPDIMSTTIPKTNIDETINSVTIFDMKSPSMVIDSEVVNNSVTSDITNDVLAVTNVDSAALPKTEVSSVVNDIATNTLNNISTNIDTVEESVSVASDVGTVYETTSVKSEVIPKEEIISILNDKLSSGNITNEEIAIFLAENNISIADV